MAKREKKISVKHYLNTKLKPVVHQGKKNYPVYIRLGYDRITTILKSNYLVYSDDIFSQENINNENLKGSLYFHGNQKPEDVQEAYQKSHFLILPSKSEGWPKVVAEAMWWGTIPIVTPISCVPYMLGESKRGVLISTDLKSDLDKLIPVLKNKDALKSMAMEASKWSRTYTLDRFNNEIEKLL